MIIFMCLFWCWVIFVVATSIAAGISAGRRDAELFHALLTTPTPETNEEERI